MLKRILAFELPNSWLVSLLVLASLTSLTVLLSGCSRNQSPATPTPPPVITQPSQNQTAPTENITQTPIIVPILPPTPTPVPTPPPTPVLLQVTNLTFHDYNGDGDQDSEEPGIEGIELRYEPGGYRTISDRDGRGIVNIPAGSYRLYVNDPSRKFRYILPSVSEVIPIESGNGLYKYITENTLIPVPLGGGSLTLPFRKGTIFSRPSPFGMTGMVDIDRRDGYIRSYDPSKVPSASQSGGIPPWIVDQHDGIDYCFPEGTDIVAAAPGVVKEIGFEEGGAGNYIVIYHQFERTQTLYAHLSEILVREGQEVSRNHLIAKSGNSGRSSTPHLHLRYATWTTPPNPIDPYRDISDQLSLSWWTVDNAPKYP